MRKMKVCCTHCQSWVNKKHPSCVSGSVEGIDKNRAASMRSCIEVDASENITSFLENMGFQFDYETILKGNDFLLFGILLLIYSICTRFNYIWEKSVLVSYKQSYFGQCPSKGSMFSFLSVNTMFTRENKLLS